MAGVWMKENKGGRRERVSGKVEIGRVRDVIRKVSQLASYRGKWFEAAKIKSTCLINLLGRGKGGENKFFGLDPYLDFLYPPRLSLETSRPSRLGL